MEMDHWLYEQISKGDNNRKPGFSVRAITNWFKALRLEIESTHGRSIPEQIDSCRKFYINNTPKKMTDASIKGELFEHLFFSVIYCMTVDRFGSDLKKIPWIYPTAIVDWYYSIYFSLRSMLPIFGHKIPEDHSKAAKFVASTFRTHLPYPFDMFARRSVGEEYQAYLKGVQTEHCDLNSIFQDDSKAQGMLAQYLCGTAAWYTLKTKQNILADKKLDISNFRTNRAKMIRDNRLVQEIGFLHCAYRQRTKANYRDSIYLSYNFGDHIYLDTFLYTLSFSAKFASIAAFACVEHHVGRKTLMSFVEDLNKNIRGIDTANQSEKYWTAFL